MPSPRGPLAALVVCILLAGCGAAPAADPPATVPGFPVTIDRCGAAVTFDAPPRRVLTIGTVAVRLLHAVGANERVAARAGEFGTAVTGPAGQAVAAAPVISDEDPSTEQIVGAGVDTVIGYGLFNSTPADLAAHGIRTLVNTGECGHDTAGAATARTFDDIYTDLEDYGRLFGAGDRGRAAIAGLRTRVDAIAAKAPGAGRTAASVYFFAASSGLSADGTSGIADAQFEALGLRNAFDQADEYFDIGPERLIGADPDVIVLGYGYSGETADDVRQRLLALPGITDLRAVRAGNVIPVPVTERKADPGAVDGLETIAAALR